MTDLFDDGDPSFDIPPPRARNSDPETSHKAAEAIAPQQGTILRQVEAFAYQKGEGGFIDEDLSGAFEAETVSSYRTRRAELTERNVILDSGRRKNNSGGRECVVWIHRQFVLQPPSERDATKRAGKTERDAAFTVLDRWARQMKNEGRVFVWELEEAIATLKR